MLTHAYEDRTDVQGGWGVVLTRYFSVAAIHLLQSISVKGLKEEIGKGVSSVKNMTFSVP